MKTELLHRGEKQLYNGKSTNCSSFYNSSIKRPLIYSQHLPYSLFTKKKPEIFFKSLIPLSAFNSQLNALQ